jgi:hypothetical protein
MPTRTRRGIQRGRAARASCRLDAEQAEAALHTTRRVRERLGISMGL